MNKPDSDGLFLGVDGGGTRCRVRLRDGLGNILGEAVRGGANTRLGLDKIFSEITAAAHDTLDQAAIPRERIRDIHAGMGLAGLSLERERKHIAAYPHPFASAVFETDAYTACLGAHNDEDGAILIVGTGTCGQAIVDGRQLAIAGWGFEISDIGGSARIGKQALEKALLAHEKIGMATSLTHQLMAHFHHSPEEMVSFAETACPSDFGQFALTVFDALDEGDAIARDIVGQARLANEKILRHLMAFGAPKLSLMGGIARRMADLMSDDIQAKLVPAVGDALEGAILMAKHLQEERQ
ncbi:BadF/BadG/BcrA/BcrD ATPase family protein [Thalassospira sp. TSL5-1]|uniref:BadF/BadG/BcrA/BcrD ATPase family protein n=1 Tax=Thalassospira sp. TSL5-1 TaxID=1544451 RepID=UPI00093D1536|nr:BadF/BadG/BcrA/BcrD ATPase family protein [Thalassospira sp. TSL5-1]OKH89888.1 N-acetylglucosamine kinase [Thalassospira sp. TSL5-1]